MNIYDIWVLNNHRQTYTYIGHDINYRFIVVIATMDLKQPWTQSHHGLNATLDSKPPWTQNILATMDFKLPWTENHHGHDIDYIDLL